MKIFDYQILEDNHELTLAKKVKQEILNGWIPQGGVSLASGKNSDIFLYAQAMVKVE